LLPFRDPHEKDPAHRYKAACGPPNAYNGGESAACLAHSPDGLRWSFYNGGKPVTGRACDTMNQLLWDEDARLYRLYTRQDYGTTGLTGELGACSEIRGTRAMTNPNVKADATAWKTVRKWRFDREKDEHKRRQIMCFTNTIYEGVHFGLVNVYTHPEDLSEGKYDLHKRHERDVIDYFIATCRGDEKWNLSWIYADKPIVPRGPQGSFDQDWVWPATYFVTHNDRHWLYYTGSRERHWMTDPRKDPQDRYGIGVATLRLDGFVFLQAKDQTATVTTKPFKLEGGKLEVNVAATQGDLAVEVLDEAGQPVPDYARTEAQAAKGVDDLRHRPRWKGRADLADLKGKTVRLKFYLRNAKLYAFQVKA
jgi:hypothetical protein